MSLGIGVGDVVGDFKHTNGLHHSPCNVVLVEVSTNGFFPVFMPGPLGKGGTGRAADLPAGTRGKVRHRNHDGQAGLS